MPWATDEEIKKFHTAFDKADKDGGGSIDISELKSVMAELGKELFDNELQQMLKQADADGSGTVDFQEFCGLMGRKVENFMDADEEVLQEVFKVYDKVRASGCRERWPVARRAMTARARIPVPLLGATRAALTPPPATRARTRRTGVDTSRGTSCTPCLRRCRRTASACRPTRW